MAAGGVTEAVTIQEMEQQILKQIPKLQLRIGETAILVIFIIQSFTLQMHLVQVPLGLVNVSICTYNCNQLKVLQIWHGRYSKFKIVYYNI